MPRPPDDELRRRRGQMVESQIRARGIADQRVLDAMARVPRHRFVRERDIPYAYADSPVDIGLGQTISQPYIVAVMTEALALTSDAVVLEIGTGSAYQTAILAEIAREVYSVEIVPQLASRAATLIAQLNYTNVHLCCCDGYTGWPEAAPYDAVIVTAAVDHLPPPLVDQLAIGGRLVVPVGRGDQDLLVFTRTAEGLREDRGNRSDSSP